MHKSAQLNISVSSAKKNWIFSLFFISNYMSKKKLISLKQTFKYEPKKKFSILVLSYVNKWKMKWKNWQNWSQLEIQGYPQRMRQVWFSRTVNLFFLFQIINAIKRLTLRQKT